MKIVLKENLIGKKSFCISSLPDNTTIKKSWILKEKLFHYDEFSWKLFITFKHDGKHTQITV